MGIAAGGGKYLFWEVSSVFKLLENMENNQNISGGNMMGPPPEISIEWENVEIEVKVMGPHQLGGGYVRLFPDLDQNLLSSEELDQLKRNEKELRRKERQQMNHPNTAKGCPICTAMQHMQQNFSQKIN